ncbi:MAG: glycosyltransferase family 2 protein [Holosporaceae bacterium]|jgi:glycosyltransferase involved in cell wall biosynthesis|nr:glycosyltransferase family 2 protein [Holosporaceae bacterium]
MEKIEISVVIPFYNEADAIDAIFKAIIPVLKRTKLSFEVLCINDGSKDDTAERLIVYKEKYPQLKIINFSRNFGKDAALSAGLDLSVGKCVIPIDCDLQDPPELILEMLKKWKNGAEVVLAKRFDRSCDTIIKRTTAKLFYKIYNYLSDIELPENVGDFRLLDRKVVDVIKTFSERNRFMKGLLAFSGFRTGTVEYQRQKRSGGKSKWSYWKLWNYAIEGITSFSIVPLKVSTYLGIIMTLFSFIRGFWILFRTVIFGIDVQGYASLITAILFLGGVQLISLGIIGEYLGRVYIESKQRPLYIIREII